MEKVIGLWTTKLKNTRENLGFSQKQLGTLMNYSATWVSQAERDEYMAKTAMEIITIIRGDMNPISFKRFAEWYVSAYQR